MMVTLVLRVAPRCTDHCLSGISVIHVTALIATYDGSSIKIPFDGK